MAFAHRLPPEMVDYIVDCFASEPLTMNDRTLLAKCSLVSRDWLHRSSLHLLKHLEILAMQLEEFQACAQMSTRLTTYVRELVICGSTNKPIDIYVWMSCMPQLRLLQFWSNRTPSFVEEAESTIADGRDETRLSQDARPGSLTISQLRVSSIPFLSLIRFLQPFSHIDILDMRTDTSSVDRSHPLSESVLLGPDRHRRMMDRYQQVKQALTRAFEEGLRVRPTTSVAQLTLDHSSFGYHEAALLAAISLRPSTIAFCIYSPEHLNILSDVAGDFGHNLEHLTLLITGSTGPGHLHSAWYRRQNTRWCGPSPKLQTVDIDFVDLKDIMVASYCTFVLIHFCAISLSRFSITVPVSHFSAVLTDMATNIRVGPMDYKNLQKLEFRVLGEGVALSPDLRADLQAQVKAKLPERLSGVTQITS